MPTPAPIVFFDIAGPDVATLRSFYADLFDWNISDYNQFAAPTIAPLPGSLRQDPSDKRIYLGVDDVTEKLEQIAAHGGTIDAPRFEVPGVVILGLFKDPAGNAMGLVEMADGTVKVPSALC